MAALPYMPLYVADYLADAAHLTTTQHGAYLLLIMNYWQRGCPLPDDDRRLASIARLGLREWKRNRPALEEFFTLTHGAWVHSRIDHELARVSAKSLKSKKAAQASVERRFGKRSADVEPTDTDTEADTSVAKATSPRPWARPVGVNEQVWSDFLSNRKRKRLGNTPTAWKLFQNDLSRVSVETGIPPPRLIEHAAAKGWGSINNPNDRSVGNERHDNPTALAVQRLTGAFGTNG
jgi:uncharacterized protein YdaU (DUF1376 family)